VTYLQEIDIKRTCPYRWERFGVLKRREIVTLFAGAALWPFAARADSPLPVIGMLAGGTAQAYAPAIPPFYGGLSEAGYIERQSVAFEYRWAENHYDRLPALAADLVHHEVAVIATFDTASAIAAKASTAIIPIVFSMGADPMKIGIVDSLARPGGNVTGVSYLLNALGAKRLGLLHEIVPKAATFGFLVDPTNPNTKPETIDIQTAAETLGYKLVVAGTATASEIDTAFAKFLEQKIDALIVAGQGFFVGDPGRQVGALALQHRIPSIYSFRESVLAGGLLSYSGSRTESNRQAGIYVGRILKGEKPADMPVQTSSKFEMVINLKTASALGLTIPSSVLASADELIE
jgi:putative ABC transport system substrate-binding protein